MSGSENEETEGVWDLMTETERWTGQRVVDAERHAVPRRHTESD